MDTKTLILAAGTFVLFLVGLAVLATLVAGPLQGMPGLGKAAVALVPMDGTIGLGDGPFGGGLDPDEFIERLDKVQDDTGVDAVVLVINSPGGSVVGSKRIVHKVRELREEKPVVSWIGDMGASGAYYVASASDYIMADEDSLTGSIGVVSEVHNYQVLLEKLGVSVEVLKEGRFKDLGSPFSEFDEEERQLLQELLAGVDRHFKRDVMEFRGERMDEAKFNAVADGRILSGEQAFESELIDELGTLKQAVQVAGERAGFEGEPNTKRIGPREPTLLDLLAASGYHFGRGLKAGMVTAEQSIQLR